MDCFALFDLPPRAALDEEDLQARYFEKARAQHPDQVEGDSTGTQATQLNTAFETLRLPERRLKHLLELGTDTTTWRAVPLDAALMAIFEKLGPILQQAAAFQKRRHAATTALARALLAPQEMQLRESLEDLGTPIEERRDALLATLSDLDLRIASADPTAWPEVQATQARFAYLAKWQAQIREALLRLM